MSDFIQSMDVGGLSDRPPESNVMPLPDQRQRLGGLGVGVGEADQARRVDRALADADDAAVAAVGERLLVQHLDAQPGRAAATRSAISANSAGHRSDGRGVDQVADERDRLGEHGGATAIPSDHPRLRRTVR